MSIVESLSYHVVLLHSSVLLLTLSLLESHLLLPFPLHLLLIRSIPQVCLCPFPPPLLLRPLPSLLFSSTSSKLIFSFFFPLLLLSARLTVFCFLTLLRFYSFILINLDLNFYSSLFLHFLTFFSVYAAIGYSLLIRFVFFLYSSIFSEFLSYFFLLSEFFYSFLSFTNFFIIGYCFFSQWFLFLL